MGRTLTTIVVLGAFALMPAPAHAARPVTSTTVTAVSDNPASAGAAQSDRRVGGLYLGGATGRYVQFVSLALNRRATQATERATLVVRCTGDPAIPSVLDNLTLAQIGVADGRAKGSGVIEEDIPPSVPAIGGLSRRGVVNYRIRVGTLGRAAGILRSRFTLTDPASGAVRARCDTGTVRWSARIATRGAGRGRPAPAAGSGYFGATAQGLPFLLEVLPGGRAVRPAGMAFRASCPSLRGVPLDLVAAARMPISRAKRKARGRQAREAGGRFGSSGRLTRRFSSEEFGPVTETYTWRLRGRFGAVGVAGTWSVTGTVVREADGVEVATCTTGPNRWRAVQ